MQVSREIDFENLLKIKNSTVGPMIHFEPIDLKVGGFRSRLVVLGGFSGSYKSTFAFNIAYNNVIRLGYTAAILSLEMEPDELWLKLLLRHSLNPKFRKYRIDISVPNNSWLDLSPDHKKFLLETVGPDLRNCTDYGHIIIFTMDDLVCVKYNFKELLDMTQKHLDGYKINYGVDLLIIDYIQLLAAITRPSGNDRYQFTGDAIRFFKNFTQSYKNITGDGINVIALSQINREGFKNAKLQKGKYDLTSLAESSELVNAADLVITLYADECDKKNKVCKVQLLKNRFGETFEEPDTMLSIPEKAYIGDYFKSTQDDLNYLVNSLLGLT
jgi:replicative DNA helicase